MQNTHTSQHTNNEHAQGAIAMDVLFGGLGAAFAPAVDHAWNALDTASEIYTDRAQPSNAHQFRTNGTYELGVKQSLGGTFGLCADLSGAAPLGPNNDNQVYTKRAEMEMSRAFKPSWAA